MTPIQSSGLTPIVMTPHQSTANFSHIITAPTQLTGKVRISLFCPKSSSNLIPSFIHPGNDNSFISGRSTANSNSEPISEANGSGD